VDSEGYIRYDQIGGGYAEIEQVIQSLLQEGSRGGLVKTKSGRFQRKFSKNKK